VPLVVLNHPVGGALASSGSPGEVKQPNVDPKNTIIRINESCNADTELTIDHRSAMRAPS